MKYLVYFEELNKWLPEVGDYVLIKNHDFLRMAGLVNNIGRIVNINSRNYDFFTYEIEFENILSSGSYSGAVSGSGLLCWSDKREDIVLQLGINKFNV